jgi:hypothetical protein
MGVARDREDTELKRRSSRALSTHLDQPSIRTKQDADLTGYAGSPCNRNPFLRAPREDCNAGSSRKNCRYCGCSCTGPNNALHRAKPPWFGSDSNLPRRRCLSGRRPLDKWDAARASSTAVPGERITDISS